ncbi:MAG: replication initiator protein A [Rhodospirillaceae bacterium]|nr:replication initiator protein A [Rhodospirillaceae bacterium]
MEHPFFSLSKKPDTRTRRYTDRHGNRLTVQPLAKGLPTIWDKDLLIFAISKIMDARRRGEDAGPTIRFHIADVIEFGQMTKGGATYRRLDTALHRLAGCTITTNIRTGNEETTDIFHIIDRATIKRQYNRSDGRLEYVEFTLSDWLWRAVEAREVLTLHPDYFRLRQALARRLYEIARKHCGRKQHWDIGLPVLREKSGSTMNLRRFRHQIRQIAIAGDLLDYDMELAVGRSSEVVRFTLRKDSRLAKPDAAAELELSESALRQAAEIIGAAGKLSAAEADFRTWVQKKGIVVRRPDNLFLKFCEIWLRHAALPAARNAPPSLRDELALDWWRSLDRADREAYSEEIGIRIEIAGTQYIRDEPALARRAFDNRYPQWVGDPATVEFPALLLERLEGMIGPRDVTAEALAAAWRVHAPADPVLCRIEDPVVSLRLFAEDVKNGKAAALQAVQAVGKAPMESRQDQEGSVEASAQDDFEAWRDRAYAWWEQLDGGQVFQFILQYGDAVENICTASSKDLSKISIAACLAYRDLCPDDPLPGSSPLTTGDGTA